MQVKLLKEIVISIGGPGAVGLVDLLHGKKNVNEFFIAKKLNLNINQTRNILYKLTDAGLVSFVRKKDRKNGGWYTYYWTLDIGKSLENLRNIFLQEIKKLEEQLHARQHQRFYYCSNCDLEMDEEHALLQNFTCPECGEVLGLRDGGTFVNALKPQIEKRQEQLLLVGGEIALVERKAAAIRKRRVTTDARKKRVQRALKRKATASLKKAGLVSLARKRRIRKKTAYHRRTSRRQRKNL